METAKLGKGEKEKGGRGGETEKKKTRKRGESAQVKMLFQNISLSLF